MIAICSAQTPSGPANCSLTLYGQKAGADRVVVGIGGMVHNGSLRFQNLRKMGCSESVKLDSPGPGANNTSSRLSTPLNTLQQLSIAFNVSDTSSVETR